MPTTQQALSDRTLNRTLLERQLLLHRTGRSAYDVTEWLLGLQSQTPSSPYPGLWSRIGGFGFGEVGRLLVERKVVRLALMRSTVHLVTAQDAPRLRQWLAPYLDRTFRSSTAARGAAPADRAEVVAYGSALLREHPRSPAELRAAFAERFPAADPAALVNALRSWAPLVQVPPRGVWGEPGGTVYALLDDWLGKEPDSAPDPGPDPAELVRRYLAAFGPASVADMQKWCGLTGLKPHFTAQNLRTYTARDGRLLYDLPEAQLTDPDTPVSARYVADFDNLLLSHADRTRIVPEAYRSRVMTVNGLVHGTILVDGFVAGTWRFAKAQAQAQTHARAKEKSKAQATATAKAKAQPKGAATVAVTPFAPLAAADRDALTAEGLRLLAAAHPQAAHDVTFAPAN